MLGISVRNFSDPDEYRKALHPAELQLVVTGRGRFEAELTQIKLGSLWMQRGHFSLPAVAHSRIPKDRRMFFLQFDSHQMPILHSGIEVAPSEIICYPLGSEHHYRTSASYHCGGMSLAQDDFAAYEGALVGQQQLAPSTMRVVRPQPALMSRLLTVHKAITDLAATAPDILLHPEVGKAIEQELVRAMVTCLADPETEVTNRPKWQRLSVMSRFERMLEAHSNEPLYMADICAGISVGERTLRLHCQGQLGMSPQRYLRLRRMNLARRALTQADPAVKTVTEVANDYGFAELGRFAVAYRQLFGESPVATLRRPPDLSPIGDQRAFR
jgi:AraC-like DNA-binding protein